MTENLKSSLSELSSNDVAKENGMKISQKKIEDKNACM